MVGARVTYQRLCIPYLCTQLCQKYAAETNTGSQLHASCTNKSVPRLLCCAVSDTTGHESPEMLFWHGE
jgi:hypothetical protein